jgi:ABC-type polar amino acid transport system ATPase subunit
MSYVEMKSVVKAFDQTEVIHGVDLVVEKEEFTVFVGSLGLWQNHSPSFNCRTRGIE